MIFLKDLRFTTSNIYLLVFLFFSFIVKAQEVPPINIFTSEDYAAENQNWDITQAPNKFIYVANNAGLLEYNGEKWQLYKTPNRTILRSVKWYNGKIYTGFYMDFGYWTKNEFGILEYTSLTAQHNLEMLEDEQIWEITELDSFLIFKSLSRIYIFNSKNNSFNIINGIYNLTKINKIENTIYYQDLNNGVFKIVNGNSELVSNNKYITNNRIVELFTRQGKLHFITQNNGIFYLDNGQIIKSGLLANSFFVGKTIYSAKILKNGDIALGTIANGVFIINQNSETKYHINLNNGLTNNTVLDIYEDVDQNLWLGLDNGINVANLSSPFKFFISKNKFWGTIYSSIIYKGNLYLGTNQGLYVRPFKSNIDFKLIKGTQGQVWNLQEFNGQLFCSHDSGTFLINNSIANKIVDIEGTWGVSLIDENTILQGNYNGLYIVEKSKGQWKLRNKLEGFTNSSKYFIKEGNQIFVNHEYKGVFILDVNKELTKVVEIKKDTSVEKGIHSSLIRYKNKILYSSQKGVYNYNFKNNIFTRDSLLSKLIPKRDFLSAKLILDKRNDKLWSFTNNDLRYATYGLLSNNLQLNIIPLKGSIHKSASGYENLFSIDDSNYFIGTSNGFLLLDLNAIKEPKDFSINITNISIREKDSTYKYANLNQNLDLSSKQNNIQFNFSVPNYDRTASLTYQHKLEGFNSRWSDFTDENYVLYENLPSGDYVFKIRAKLNNKLSNNSAAFQFSIGYPWYKSNTAFVVYVLCIGLLIFLWFYFSKKYYAKQRRRLLDKAQRELELKELENEKRIVKLNNEKLRDDIRNKNRELATSTMSIIKKNEFLNTIKTELLKQDKSSIPKVIKIIDKNLNNTDDWKLFQEAFNNADKNFLKKIKNKHENLTPNDLRLCAYLRLNLSSKEIAPLLNISPRSVEVKRYRLRKKMNLEHNMNLTDYILSL